MTHPELIDEGPREGTPLILAHGAGAGMRSDFMNEISARLTAGGVRVIRFEFPYMAARREGRRPGPDRPKVLMETWRSVAVRVKSSTGAPFIGGKSLGGRIASMIADDVGAAGLICLGYPFHPPGRPDKLRTEHLYTMSTPTLIVQGERDAFGTPEEIESFRLPSSIRIEVIPDGDHSFKPRKRSGHSIASNLERITTTVLDFIHSTIRGSTSA